MHTNGCGVFRRWNLPTNRSRKGFPSIRANRLESRCFGARDGETPATARDSNEFERGAVRTICLAASEQGPSRPRDETGLAHDLQLHFVFALLGLSVEGTANREGSPRPSRDSLHPHISRLSAMAGRRML